MTQSITDNSKSKRKPFLSAIVRPFPNSYVNCVTTVSSSESPINLSLAHAQHQAYIAAIQRILGKNNVLIVDTDEAHPDCGFVEDTMVVVRGVGAVVTHPGHPSRRGEVVPMIDALKQMDHFAGKVHVMSGDGVHVDGGDVLYTGRHIFAGLSKRTTPSGVQFLSDAFSSHVPVHPLIVKDSILHLKCLVTCLTSDTLVVSDTPAGRFAFDEIQKLSGNQYNAVFVPDLISANVVSFPDENGGLKAVFVQKGFPSSTEILKNAIAKIEKDNGMEPGTIEVLELDMSEIIKGDGALTCCSVLI